MADINFLPEQSVEDTQRVQRQKKTNFFAVLSLLVVMGILIALSLYWLFLTVSTSTTHSAADQKEKEVLNEKEKEVVRRALVDKLSTSEQLLSTNTPFSVALDKVTSILAEKSISLKDSNLSVGKDLTFSMSFSNADEFQHVVDALTNSDLEKVFGNSRLSSYKKDGPGNPYTFVVDIKFLSKGIEGFEK